MPRYSNEQIEQVRSSNDIVDVVGTYVRLKRSGSTYMGLCPFHNEKTPSFSVNPSMQIFHCFGCGAKGNVLTFVMEYENYSFIEALEYLAERAGITLPRQELSAEQKQQESLRQSLLEINRKAAAYYYTKLKSPQGEIAYEYLNKRGLQDETIRKFGLGYAGAYGKELYQYLKHEGYDDHMLQESGLFKIKENGVFDKFWDRVIFPIMDVNNRVIAFGGRVMGDGKPKYLNSPETKLFDKSRNLFALGYAKQGSRKSIILCEGYMDVIALHQAGFNGAVASLGTAFTEHQAILLRRYTEEVLLCYDSDGAGVKAALRAIPILRKAGLHGKMIHMEPYKDPDEFINALGTEAFQERIDQAENSFFFEVGVLQKEHNLSDPEERTHFIHEIAKKLLVFEDKVQRDSYLEALTAKYGIRQEDLRGLVIRYSNRMPEGYQEVMEERRQEAKRSAEKQENGIYYSYRLLLSWLTTQTDLYDKLKQVIQPVDFADDLYRRVTELLYEQLEAGDLQPARIMNYFQEAEEHKQVAEIFQTEFAAEMNKQEQEKALNELVIHIKEYSIEQRTKTLTDMAELQELVKQKKMLQNPGKLHISL